MCSSNILLSALQARYAQQELSLIERFQLKFLDFQDYEENMESHRDNKKWKQWSLESTAKILERRFPNSFVWVIRPSRYHQSTFACYHNFVEANLLGVPDHTNHDYGALFHLRALLESAVKKRKYSESFCLD